MQNTQSLYKILKQIGKLQDSIHSLDKKYPIANLELDLALEKLRGIYDVLLQLQSGKPANERMGRQEEEYLNSFDVEDIIAEPSDEEPDFETEETIETPVAIEKTVGPDIKVRQEEKNMPVEKNEEPLSHPVENKESHTGVKAQTEPHVKASKTKTIEPTEEPAIIQNEERSQQNQLIIQNEIPSGPTIKEEQKAKTVAPVGKKSFPKENSGKVIGDQLGAEKKSLYDLISGNKGDKDIASQFKKKPLTDIHKAVSLNDKIWFTKELFNNDGELYRKYVDLLNQCTSLEEGLTILTSNFNWDSESSIVHKFLSIVSRRFI